MAVYHHGVEVHETTDLSTLIRDIDTSVIGLPRCLRVPQK